MQHSKATKALCAVLAIALVACPFIATAARVAPQRSLLGSNPETIGFIPVWKPAPASFAPSGCTPGVTCAVGQLLGFIPILKSTSGLLGSVVIELGNLVSVVTDVVGEPIPAGLTILPTVLGEALSLVNVALGPLRPILGGSVVGGVVDLVTGLLGTVLGLVSVVLGTVVTLVDGLLVAVLGDAVQIAGILPLTSNGGVLGGLLSGLLGGGGPIAGIPFLTALSSADPVPALLEPQVLGALLGQDGSSPTLSLNTFFPKELSVGAVNGKNIVGVLPLYSNPAPAVGLDVFVGGLISVSVDVTLPNGLLAGLLDVNVDALGAPIGYIIAVGDKLLQGA